MKSLVSILIPAYNAERWIAETLRSAAAQTWESKEIIVVDDGSTDRTLEIARSFESKSIHVVSQHNQGASAARNRALSLSRGDYIQWLDADDLLAPDKIQYQMDVAATDPTHRILISSSWGKFIHRPSRARFVRSCLWSDLTPVEFMLRKMEWKVYMLVCSWLVSRSLSEAAGPWDTTISLDDDGEYFSRVILASSGIRFLEEAKAYYRSVGTESLSWARRSDRKLEGLWRSIQLNIGRLRALDDGERARRACLRYLQNYAIDFYPQRIDIVKEMAQTAERLGGHLEQPAMSWKYAWIRAALGWNCATRAQVLFPSLRWGIVRFWDRIGYALEKQRLVGRN